MLKFNSPLILVTDMARSRHFYEHLLSQKVKFDFGPDLPFEGFTIHHAPHFQTLLGESALFPFTQKSNWGELYFETDDLQAVFDRLSAAGVEFIHPVTEQPWGQRVMRFYDPDGHIIEIGETMEAVVFRYFQLGFSIAAVSEKTAMPPDFIQSVINQSVGANHVPPTSPLSPLPNEKYHPEMTANDVIEFIELLTAHDIVVWIDGGWGVDALLEAQTRQHSDLDIAVQHKDIPQIRALLEARNYKDVPRDDTRDCNFVLGDDHGRLIDIHSFTFDTAGNIIFGVPYPFDSLKGIGLIAGYPVKCITPEWMVKFHTGYPLDAIDYHDTRLLCQKFNIPIPPEFASFIQ